MRSILVRLGLLVALIGFPTGARGEMSSPTYLIFADTIGVAGGEVTTTSVYTLTDTFSEVAATSTTGSTYTMRGGFQAMERGSLNMTLSSASLNLGTLSATAVSSASTVVSVTTDSATGFTISLSDVSGSMPTGVSDGTVSIGVEEYGVAVSGNGAAYSGDAAVANGLTLVSRGDAVVAEQYTLTFKASKGSGSVAGTYSQNMTVVASATL